MKTITRILSILLVFVSFISFSQDGKIITEEIESYEEARKEKVRVYLENHQNYKSNRFSVLVDIINGKPIHVENHNQKAARATRTNLLQLGGDLGLDLEGEGLKIGLWEVGGHPLLNHFEFRDDNGDSKITVSDNVSQSSFHATHVAGTLAAKGLNSGATGMATKANLLAFDNLSDVTEVLAQARDNGLLLSNHSYGIPVRNLDDNEWVMGAYNNSARTWDAVIELNPSYLMVVSAGNDGNAVYDGGLGSRLDKLTGEKNAKNNLVVANASDVELDDDSNMVSATINSSSSQGPTDDGRIKPDITGLGTQLISTSNASTSAYGVATGTSMSAPNVTGSAALLQELYSRLNNKYMLASTLKGLICVTADDFGLEGPDPIGGWGIMNSKKAAEAIINNEDITMIFEHTLVNNSTYTFNITKDQFQELEVGVVWTDVRGDALENDINNPRPALVNDIDLKIIGSDETEYFPWKLDLENLTSPAIKGDNTVDTVEIINIDNSSNDTYTVEVSHKGTLDDETQIVSIIVTGITTSTLSSENFTTESISFWPNPVKDNLNISSKDFGFSNDVSVSIYDMMGREILSVSDFSNPNALSVDLSSLSNGVYIVNLTDGEQTINNRIIKE
ncbi:secreted subtilisin-like protease, S8 peptidase family [Psychroflexus torquis ATCC 700755]|uniref:Secreted subtilisin-like protease, S8 peptidase family n=1 Tax=Psychroflexus torquis (strain ATCC 700755 / CIP 106069 / ACAM 623) TaxID=313595 RepID=K4IBN2_PSYTT|nr:S8 family serine peptidase [Psychroflexus torquis]AFU67997.1 secreted subtilisin-like protease, S8 peptidase family [Psychroflexus torquis ATCC 700755]